MNPSERNCIVWPISLLAAAILVVAGACKKAPESKPRSPEKSSASPASSSASTDGPSGKSEAPTGDETEPPISPQPRLVVWVEGSPEENTIWRGWPALVRIETLAGDPPADVQLRGPASVALTRAGSVWLVSPTSSATLPVGKYTLSAAGQQIAVMVADSPGNLSPEQRSIQSALLVHSALLTGNSAEAKQAAEAWVQASPEQFEAREALGDVLRAGGDATGALDAYNAAVRRVPRGIDPPPGALHGKIAALLRERAESLPTKTAAAPTSDETKYFELIDAGDQAVAAGNRNDAANRYAEAEAWHHDRTLGVPLLELHDKRAALAETSSAPALGPATLPAVVAPPTPHATFPTNVQTTEGKIVPSGGLSDATVSADPAGQWASAASAGSQYGNGQYAAAQATGAPNIKVAGNSPDAWCPAKKNDGTEWLEVAFAKAVHATEVRISQNDAPGCISKIEAIEPNGAAHVWWEGVDPYVPPATREIAWFAVRVPKTNYLVAKVKITLNLAAVSGWKEIDAVQLVSGD